MIFFFTNCVLGPGGGQSIMVRVANELASRRIPCAILDIPSGFIWKSLAKNQSDYVKLVSIEGRQDLDGIVSESDTVIAFQQHALLLATYFSQSNPRLLIWDISGFDWWDGFLSRGRPRWIMESGLMKRWRKRLALQCAAAKGIVFLNEVSRLSFQNTMECLSVGVGPIIPVPVPMPLQRPPLTRIVTAGNITHGVYIGRSEPWKVSPAKRIAQDFVLNNRIRLTVITDDVETFRQSLNIECNNIDFIEGLSGKHLETYLLDEADVCFGMGTACLEGARLGLPSILCDFTMDGSAFPPEYGYRWLFNEDSFSLGRKIGNIEKVPGFSGSEILSQLKCSSEEIGKRCWDAVSERYEISSVVGKLLTSVQETQLTLEPFRSNPGFRIFLTKNKLSRSLSITQRPWK